MNQIHRCEDASHDAEGALGSAARELASDLEEKTVKRLLARLGMAHRRLRELSEAEHAMVERVRRHAVGGGFYPQATHRSADGKPTTAVAASLYSASASSTNRFSPTSWRLPRSFTSSSSRGTSW